MGAPVSAARATRVAQLLGLAPAPPPPGRIPAMLAARRAMIDMPYHTAGDAIVVHPPVRRLMATERPKMDELLSEVVADRAIETLASGAQGAFAPMTQESAYVGLLSYPVGDRMTRKHELMHGYAEAAKQGLPGMPLGARMVASSPRFLADPLDEYLAMRADGTRFMDIPWGAYADDYRTRGQQGAARVAQGLHAAQKAGRFASDYAPYLAAGAVGTGMMAYGLSQDDDEVAAEDMAELLAFLRENAVAR